MWAVLESFCKQHKGGGQGDFRAAVRELRRQHEWQKLIQVLEWYLHSDWLKPSVNTFNLLMEAYGRVGAVDKAEAIFDSLPSATCIPSLDSYNVLLAAYLRVGQLGKAEEAYISLQAKGYKPGLFRNPSRQSQGANLFTAFSVLVAIWGCRSGDLQLNDGDCQPASPA